MSIRTPKYRLHKGSGQALVQINGRRIYLGKYGTEQSKQRYRQVVADWLRNGPATTPDSNKDELTLVELMAAYMTYAESYYVKDGRMTDEIYGIRAALRPLKEMYGRSLVRDFKPSHLKNVRQWMIEQDLSRNYIKKNVNRIRGMFRWGVENEMVPVAVHQALLTVRGLKKGRTKAREIQPVKPVSEAVLQATLPQLSDVVRSMVLIQRMSGCRPGEVRILRPCDVDTTGEVWIYQPRLHKTEHLGHERRVYLGPRAQEVLKPWLDRDVGSYCFSPREAVVGDRENAKATKTQKDKARRPRGIRRGACFSRGSYRKAIMKACKRAGVEHWSPNQLRHNRATELRARYGLDAAQTVLGHSSADVTQVYAERDFEKARRVMLEFG